jgi:cyclophilin family peptidyl-prolyl cis-trans isomerase
MIDDPFTPRPQTHASRCGPPRFGSPRLTPLLIALLGPIANAPAAEPFDQVAAELRITQFVHSMDLPIEVEFVLHNRSDKPVTLAVPDSPASPTPLTQMGLPEEHIFSGKNQTALEILTTNSGQHGGLVSKTPTERVAPVQIAARASVGRRVDVTKTYFLFRQPGEYRFCWKPYGGQLVSNWVTIRVVKPKVAVVDTDFGSMTFAFFYEYAPHHVDSFIELASAGFYDGLTFHRIWPGILMQGGCPKGDGSGSHPDGRLLRAEFNGLPHEFGTLSMARLPDDVHSASCQFFIALGRIEDYDGAQTLFGKIVDESSAETLRKLADVPLKGPKPAEPLVIRKITIMDAPKPETPAGPP